MFATLALALASTFSTAQDSGVPPPSPLELRSALDGLRGGKLQGTEHDAAFAKLPALLASNTEFFVSSGAYLAGEKSRAECIPNLIAALERENLRATDASAEPTRCLLDALIRLNARVSANVLFARAQPEFASQIYLLLARIDPPDRDGLLRLIDLDWDDLSAHGASACTLTQARDPRIAHRLLLGRPWHFVFFVCDAGDDSNFPEEGGSMSIACRAHPMWPPRVRYSLTLPTAGSARQDVEFLRSEFRTCWQNEGLERIGEPPRMPRVRFMESLLGEFDPAFRDKMHEDVVILFETDARFLTALESSADATLESLRAAIRRAAERELLTDVQAAAKELRLQIQVRDCRRPGGVSLPKPKPRANVEFLGLP